MATCKGPRCGAEIRWVESRKGGRIPLDPEPDSAGNVVLEGDEGEFTAVVLPDEAAKRYTGEKFMPHWKTCADRNHFRKKATGAAGVLVLLLLGGCAATMAKLGVIDSQEDRYTYWTRYYEARMGLPPAEILFKADIPGGYCGWVDSRVEIGTEGQHQLNESLVVVSDVVTYDPTKSAEECRGREPWQLAKHEQCHRRLQHLYMRISEDPKEDAEIKEAEAVDCEKRWYR